MPVCSVAPVGMNGLHVLGDGRRRSGSARRRRGGTARGPSRRRSRTWSTCTRCGKSGSSPTVRGKCGDASAMTMRSGSAMTRCSSCQAAPECSDRLIQPSASGAETAAAIDAGVELLDDGREAPEVRRDELDVGARVAQEPFGRAVEAGEQADAGLREQRVEVGEQRAEHLELLEVVALAERVQEGAGLARSERDRQAVPGPHGRDRGVHRGDRHALPHRVEDVPDGRDRAEVPCARPDREPRRRARAARAPRRAGGAPSGRRRRGRSSSGTAMSSTSTPHGLRDRGVVRDDPVRAREKCLREQRHRLVGPAEGRDDRRGRSRSAVSRSSSSRASGSSARAGPSCRASCARPPGGFVASPSICRSVFSKSSYSAQTPTWPMPATTTTRGHPIRRERRARGRVRTTARVAPHRVLLDAERVGERARPARGSPTTRYTAGAARQSDSGAVRRDQPEPTFARGCVRPREPGAARGRPVEHHHGRAVRVAVLVDADRLPRRRATSRGVRDPRGHACDQPGQLVGGAQLVERALEHDELRRVEPVDELVLQVLEVHLERLVELALTGRR